MKRNDIVEITSGWMSGMRGYVERIEGGWAVVIIHGSTFPFPRCERMPLADLRRVDVDAERRQSVGEALL